MADRNHREIRVRGVSEVLPQQLKNIADHIGVSTNQFLKMQFREIVNRYPEEMRQPREQD